MPRTDKQHLIDSKWVFKILQGSDGTVRRFKARLCARGFQQKFGVDYTETFAPVARYDSLRILLAMATHLDLEMMQFDIKTAFLHGELKEEVHMKVPEGLNVDANKSQVICKLNKSLYGLKQAPRCWNQKFREFLDLFNFRTSEADKCIYRGAVNN